MTATTATKSLARLNELSALEITRAIGSGRTTCEAVARACLERIAEREPQVLAWEYLDPDQVIARARALDKGALSGPLIGVPFGVKDIIDTFDMPTAYGSPIYAGHRPRRDAACVAMSRKAGGLVMGKTVTTEFAVNYPGKTRNPFDPARTPGGSSSGSAAAVADGMVPLALGTQTTGSTIRPASFCGVYGLKPTHGLIPRHGMFQLSRSLDHVGLFARSVEDLALLLEELAAHDERDPDSRPRARIPYRALAAEEPPLTPMLGFVKTSFWDRVAADAREAFGGLVEQLGDRVEEVELVTPLDEVIEWQRVIGGAEIAINLRREYETGRDKLSGALRARIEHGRDVRALDYLAALGRVPELTASLTELFEQRYDALITPAAFGTAPKGLESTGDPAFCALWTLCGMPALNVPLLQGANGLPLGVQLVGARHRDARLLRTARWLVNHLSNAA